MNKLRSFAITLCSVILWSVSVALAAEPPNIVLLLADDMGYGDWPNTKIRTPNLDRLAAEGVRLTSFYAAPICTPSRAALLTGRYQVRDGWGPVLNATSPDGVDQATVADKLKKAGYASAAIGKWHLGVKPQYAPTRHGFDQFFGVMQNANMVLMRDEKVLEKSPPQDTLTLRFTQEARQFIQKNKARPFFLYLAYTAPHVPLAPNPAFAGKSLRGAYGDVLEEVDWSVGQILAALSNAGVDGNTLVIFTSDNGPWLEKGADGGSAGPLRGGKLSVLEGGIRVPFVARWPGQIPANRAVAAPAMNIDVYPTLTRLAGQKITNPARFDGKDIGPLLLGTGPRAGSEFLFYHMNRLRGFRSGNWKLMLSKDGTPGQLYDLSADLGETRNLAGTQVARLQSLAARAKQLDAAIPRDAPPKK